MLWSSKTSSDLEAVEDDLNSGTTSCQAWPRCLRHSTGLELSGAFWSRTKSTWRHKHEQPWSLRVFFQPQSKNLHISSNKTLLKNEHPKPVTHWTAENQGPKVIHKLRIICWAQTSHQVTMLNKSPHLELTFHSRSPCPKLRLDSLTQKHLLLYLSLVQTQMAPFQSKQNLGRYHIWTLLQGGRC